MDLANLQRLQLLKSWRKESEGSQEYLQKKAHLLSAYDHYLSLWRKNMLFVPSIYSILVSCLLMLIPCSLS